MRALLSVSDKTGIVEFAAGLIKRGFELVSTGGTYKAIKDAGLEVIEISELTGFPECLDGRLKTLHPVVHGGILAIRDNPGHMDKMNELGIGMIDLLAVNLYPFKQTVAKPNVSLEEAIENIDIGGPTMLRSAAKNYRDVAVVTDPRDYNEILTQLDNGGISLDMKFRLARKVFAHTAHYDAVISDYLNRVAGDDSYPETITLTYEKLMDMRYGENPHQQAAFYGEVNNCDGLSGLTQLHGKELSFNNINDTHGALELIREFTEPTVVACKHSNPCGVGSGKDIFTAYMGAYETDPSAIFGGIVVSNREIDEKTAVEMNKIFLEIILAPSFSDKALEILKTKKNVRLLTLPTIMDKQADSAIDIKKVSGGLLIQKVNNELLTDTKTVTEIEPTDSQMKDLLFAWKVVKHTKSNAIVIARDGRTLGIGPGQVSRILAAEGALGRSLAQFGEYSQGAVMASDAFFPFPDCVEAAAEVGISAIIHPGGSNNDQASIDACNNLGIAMVTTGIRHFRH